MGHHARAPEVWDLHAQGLPVRAIADQLGMGKSTVARILEAGREVFREKQAEQVTDMAAWLLEQAREDHEASLADAEAARAAGEWRNVPAERKVRTTVRAEMARLLGVDPIRRELVQLRRMQLDAGAGVEEQLEAFFGDSPAITPAE